MLHRSALKSLLVASFILAPVIGIGAAQAADWDLAFRRVDAATVEVSWKSYSGERFQVCIKRDDAGGDVCDGKNSVHTVWVNASPQGLYDRKTGRLTTRFDLPTCGVNYKIRVKRSALSFDTGVFFQAC